jgi:hypothetical protein
MTVQLVEGPAVRDLPAGRGRGPGAPLLALPHRASRCPVPRCGDQIDPSRLMCRTHWYRVPRPLRDHVWATWRSGHGGASHEHRAAVLMAIAACDDLPTRFPAA